MTRGKKKRKPFPRRNVISAKVSDETLKVIKQCARLKKITVSAYIAAFLDQHVQDSWL